MYFGVFLALFLWYGQYGPMFCKLEEAESTLEKPSLCVGHSTKIHHIALLLSVFVNGVG